MHLPCRPQDLSDLGLKAVPPCLAALRHLAFLDLSGNDIVDIALLTALTALTALKCVRRRALRAVWLCIADTPRRLCHRYDVQRARRRAGHLALCTRPSCRLAGSQTVASCNKSRLNATNTSSCPPTALLLPSLRRLAGNPLKPPYSTLHASGGDAVVVALLNPAVPALDLSGCSFATLPQEVLAHAERLHHLDLVRLSWVP